MPDDVVKVPLSDMARLPQIIMEQLARSMLGQASEALITANVLFQSLGSMAEAPEAMRSYGEEMGRALQPVVDLGYKLAEDRAKEQDKADNA